MTVENAAKWLLLIVLSVVSIAVLFEFYPNVFNDSNQWIAAHQAIVVTVGIPLLTAASAAMVSLITTRANLKAQQKQRLLQIETQLCNSRQSWIDSVRDDLALASNLATRFETDFENAELKADLAGILARVRMRVNPNDPDDDALIKAFAKALGADQELNEWDEQTEPISIVCQRILKREWERLKLDLRAVERVSE